MGRISRRDFLRSSAHGAALLLGGAGLLAACGDGATGESAGEQAAGNGSSPTPQSTGTPGAPGGNGSGVSTPRVGLSSPHQPSYIVGAAGPVLLGSQFGLSLAADDLVVFDSHSTVVQSALSGDVDIVGASTMAQLTIIEQGLPFRMFSPFNNSDDFVVAGRGDITSLDQLMNPDVTVASDSLGGAGQTIFDAILIAEDAGFLVTDIPNLQVIGSSGGRTSALASGESQASVIHLFQAEQVDAETGDVNIIASLYESVPLFMMQGFVAPQEWLDNNLETAAAFTASVILASRTYQESYDDYAGAVRELMEEPPEDNVLRSIHELAQTYDLWPDDGGLQRDNVEFMIDLGRQEGLFAEDSDLSYEDVVDTRARDMALDMLDG